MSTIMSHFLNRIFFSQTWTDVNINSSKTAKNTEKWFSQNISGKTSSQAICVWATLIQVNQDDSASVWELCTRGIGLLMQLSSVGKCNRGRKPTLTLLLRKWVEGKHEQINKKQGHLSVDGVQSGITLGKLTQKLRKFCWICKFSLHVLNKRQT